MTQLALGNRVAETVSNPGSSDFTLLGALPAFQTFSAAEGVGDGVTVPYCAVHRASGQWEVGYGVTGAATLTRSVVLNNSSGGHVPIVFTVGTVDVFLGIPSEKLVALDADSHDLHLPGNLSLAAAHTYQINDVAVLSATALGVNVVGSGLTSVGTLTSGALGSGFGNISIGASSVAAGTGTFAGLLSATRTTGAQGQWLYDGSNYATLTVAANGAVALAAVGAGAAWAFGQAVGITGTLSASGDLNIGSGKFTAAAASGNTVVGGTFTVGGLAYTFPASQTGGYFLKTNGSGVLSWAAPTELIALTDLSDVTITSVTAGDVLRYSGTAWINEAATSLNTVSRVVARDGSGNFAAGTITAALTGNASTATALATGRAINGVTFDGTGAITVPVNNADDVATATSVYLLWTATAGGNYAAKISTTKLSFVPSTGILTATGFAGALTGNVTGNVSGSSGSCTGLAATATALATARAINGVNFDGTAAITITAAAGTLSGTTLNATVVTSSLTAVGALVTGSLASGFGAISIGASAITAGAASFTTLAASGDFAVNTNKFTVVAASGNTVVAGTLTVGTTRQWFSSETGATSWWTNGSAGTGTGIASVAAALYLQVAGTTPAFLSSTLFTSSVPFSVASTTDSSSIATGSLVTAGGLGVAKALWVGGLANIAGAATLQSTLAVSGTITMYGALLQQFARGAGYVATFQNTTSATPYCVSILDAATPTSGYPLLAITSANGMTAYFRVDSSSGSIGIGKAPSATSKLSISGLPTSNTGLVSGDFWLNANVLTIVP